MSMKRIFRGKVMGMPTEEEDIESAEIARDIMGGSTPALSGEDFSSKISNGESNRELLNGKLFSMRLNNNETFTDRIHRLTNHKSNNKNNNMFNMVKPMENESNMENKVAAMLGTTSSTKKSNRALNRMPAMTLGFNNSNSNGDANSKVNMMLGSGNSKQIMDPNMISKMLGNTNIKTKGKTNTNNLSNKIGHYLGTNNKAGPYASFNVQDKLNRVLSTNKMFGSSNNVASNALNKMLNNPAPTKQIKKVVPNNRLHNLNGGFEKVALNRILQQKGLPMFGDKDKDGLPNALDCNPVNYFKQGVADQDAEDYAGQMGYETYDVEKQPTDYEPTRQVFEEDQQIEPYYDNSMQDVQQPNQVEVYSGTPKPYTNEEVYDPRIWKTKEVMDEFKNTDTRPSREFEDLAKTLPVYGTQEVDTSVTTLPNNNVTSEPKEPGFFSKVIEAKKEQYLKNISNPKPVQKQRQPEGADNVSKTLVAGFDRLDRTFRTGLKNTTKGASKAAQAMGKASTQQNMKDVDMSKYTASMVGLSGGKKDLGSPRLMESYTGMSTSPAEQSMGVYKMASMLGGGSTSMGGGYGGGYIGGSGQGFSQMLGFQNQRPEPYSSKVNAALSATVKQPEYIQQPMQPQIQQPMQPQMEEQYVPSREGSIDQSSYGTYNQQKTQHIPTNMEQYQGRIAPTPGDANPGDLVIIEGVKYRRNPYNFPKPWKNLKTGLHINYPRGSYDKSGQTERFYQPQYVQSRPEMDQGYAIDQQDLNNRY